MGVETGPSGCVLDVPDVYHLIANRSQYRKLAVFLKRIPNRLGGKVT